jgi:uncharacterized protein involved in outer membrane biogenesis
MTRATGCLTKLLVLIAIIGVAAAAAPLFPLSPVKGSVEAKLSESLGRSVTIDSVRLKLIGGPHFALTGMTAREDPQFGDGTFLKANEVRAGLDLARSLRAGQFVIDSITIKSPQIDLVKNNNGVWSWTTLGGRPRAQSAAALIIREAISSLSILSLVLDSDISPTQFRSIKVENASVRLVDSTTPGSSEMIYKNMGLNASLAPYAEGEAQGTEAKGEMFAESGEPAEADPLTATLPFDLKILSERDSSLSVNGSLGPGSIETKNISIGTLDITGRVNSHKDSPLTGNGQISASNLVVHTINLSERVAKALKLDQIGDMSPGTSVAGLETDFSISRGVFNTNGLQIQQLDGLGDATVPNGSFKIESALNVNYAATVTLTPEATARVKTVSPTFGLFVTILESNNRVSVPINIIGDLRNPVVQVDVSRIF